MTTTDRRDATDEQRSRALGEWIRESRTSRPHRDARSAFLAGWDAALTPAPGTDTSDPSGCRWCGVGEREHASRFAPSVGQHVYAPPTESQRLARMRARRAPDTDTSGQAVQRALDPWEDNRSRGFDCEPCRGTGRVSLLGMPDGSEAATTCLDCDGTGRAAVAGPQRDHEHEWEEGTAFDSAGGVTEFDRCANCGQSVTR